MTNARRRILLPLITFGLLLCLLMVAAQAGLWGSRDAATRWTPPPADLLTPAGAAVAALTGPDPMGALTALGPDPRAALGYTPVIIDGSPAAGGGGCSSPIPLPRRFEPLCRIHDLGYDLLRWGARTGHPLGPWARHRIDHDLIEGMHRVCDDPICTAAADLVDIGVSGNTWRQGGRDPVGGEDLGDIGVSIAVAVARP
ncbi:hypothetical protein OG579_05610 [Williamsia herbipolensis]|uniref:Phospholipase n=1 Tax=Williamsia herbipolensis TaxID=1603258 RepID=A0AAU4K5M2_9NOCA|nr:hypothetical protein [Williamsia herbipolensis]